MGCYVSGRFSPNKITLASREVDALGLLKCFSPLFVLNPIPQWEKTRSGNGNRGRMEIIRDSSSYQVNGKVV